MFIIIFNKLVDIFLIILFIRVVLSWIAPNSRNDFTEIIKSIIDPIFDKCRVVLPIGRAGYLNLAPIIVYFGVKIIRNLVNYLYFRIF
ncbi:MAG: YggT family protein [Fusobacteriaceae bacterium]